ncbi:MAG: RIP metalloprotease RseP [Flavobacteriaceae bacterium]
MEIVIKLSQFLLSLSLLIVLHELGHFIPAKLFKTKVEKFYLFFDIKFSLFKKKIGETVYGIGWLPLGGYVKIAGMIDESMDTKQMKQEPQPWEFRSKPAWQRLIIMLGGVIVNFILAFVIYIGVVWFYGELDIKNSDVKDGIWVTNPILEQAGLQTGDKIISVDGQEIESFFDLPEKIMLSSQVVVNRNEAQTTVELPKNLIGQIVDENKKSLLYLRVPFVISEIQEESPNLNTLRVKDMILDINGQEIKYFDQASELLQSLKGKTVTATILRNEKKESVELHVNQEGLLGVRPGIVGVSDLEKLGVYNVEKVQYGLLESIPRGIEKTTERFSSYWNQLKKIINPKTEAYKGVGGFYAIFNVFPDVWSWEYFWNVTAFLSIMLGIMNLLPIPALDGGHVMFLLYEMITRKKPSEKFMERAQMVGFFILIALLLFANGNDIFRAFK